MSDELRLPDTVDVPPKKEEITVQYLPDATKEEAWRQGYWAYTFGMDKKKNPYPKANPRYDDWWDGWKEAREGDEG